MKLSSEDVDALKYIYTKLLKTATPLKLLKYHLLFEKMSKMVVDNDTIKEELLGISIYKSENIDIIKNLVIGETTKNKTRISYLPPNHSDAVEYDITIENLGLRSGKLYIFCYNHTIGKRSFLNVSRVKSVVSKIFDKEYGCGLDVRVKFKLNHYKKFELQENEIILETNNDCAIVEGYYFNDFIAIQRMLSFLSDCTVLEPSEIVACVVDKLLKMRAVYEG